MTIFVPEAVRATGPDPFKHVNYTLGMVLGVDDLSQDFVFHDSRLRWVTRDFLGYGTLCGLRVTAENPGSEGWQVMVAPGSAANPRGELIRVPATQCARLNRWLTAHRDEVLERAGSLPAITLYVVLCYRQCPVDLVPIPGEPCRSEDDSFAPSRIQDSFQLDLRWEPPEQREDDARRDFARWMSGVGFDETADSPERRRDFARALRQAVPQLRTPPEPAPADPPDYMVGAPPAALVIPRAAAYDYLRIAFRVWTTEMRPLWLGRNQDPAGGAPDADCVLLAELRVPLTADLQVSDVEPVEVDEEQRPFVMPLALLQDWVLRHAGAGGPPASPPSLGGDLSGAPGAAVVEGLRGQPVPAPSLPADAGKVLAVSAGGWELVRPPPVVAAGRFDAKGNPLPGAGLGNPSAKRIDDVDGASYFFLSFDAIEAGGSYMVKATFISTVGGPVFSADMIDTGNSDSADALRPGVEAYNTGNPGDPIDPARDLALRVSPSVDDLKGGLMIEISRYV